MKHKQKDTLFTLIILIPVALFGQGYEGGPCGAASAVPKNLLKKRELLNINLYINDCNPDLGQLYSSFLKASGKAPQSVKDPNFKPPENWEESDGDIAYDSWTCMYAGGGAVDGNKATAWVEGVSGLGKGELLLITRLDLSRKIEIYGGFGKSTTLFSANSRPKSVIVHVVRAKSKPGEASQCGYWFDALKIVASKSLVLSDVNQYQPLGLPAFKRETFQYNGQSQEYRYWLMIELVDVYPGSKYQDTCITEIRNVE